MRHWGPARISGGLGRSRRRLRDANRLSVLFFEGHRAEAGPRLSVRLAARARVVGLWGDRPPRSGGGAGPNTAVAGSARGFASRVEFYRRLVPLRKRGSRGPARLAMRVCEWLVPWGIVRLVRVVGRGREARSRDARESLCRASMFNNVHILPSLLSLSRPQDVEQDVGNTPTSAVLRRGATNGDADAILSST